MYDVCSPHTNDHILVFNDVHLLMSCLGAKNKEATDNMMESMRKFVKYVSVGFLAFAGVRGS